MPKRETKRQRELRHSAIYGGYMGDKNPKKPIAGFRQKPIILKVDKKHRRKPKNAPNLISAYYPTRDGVNTSK
jgi:hypothetical protein